MRIHHCCGCLSHCFIVLFIIEESLLFIQKNWDNLLHFFFTVRKWIEIKISSFSLKNWTLAPESRQPPQNRHPRPPTPHRTSTSTDHPPNVDCSTPSPVPFHQFDGPTCAGSPGCEIYTATHYPAGRSGWARATATSPPAIGAWNAATAAEYLATRRPKLSDPLLRHRVFGVLNFPSNVSRISRETRAMIDWPIHGRISHGRRRNRTCDTAVPRPRGSPCVLRRCRFYFPPKIRWKWELVGWCADRGRKVARWICSFSGDWWGISVGPPRGNWPRPWRSTGRWRRRPSWFDPSNQRHSFAAR